MNLEQLAVMPYLVASGKLDPRYPRVVAVMTSEREQAARKRLVEVPSDAYGVFWRNI